MYYCQYCSKECKSLQSIRGHERLCKLNPNFEEDIKNKMNILQMVNKNT